MNSWQQQQQHRDAFYILHQITKAKKDEIVRLTCKVLYNFGVSLCDSRNVICNVSFYLLEPL